MLTVLIRAEDYDKQIATFRNEDAESLWL